MVMKYGGKWMDNTQLSVHVQKKSASGPNIRKKLPVTGLEGGRFCRYKNIGEKNR